LGNGDVSSLAGTVRFLEYMGTHATAGIDTPAGLVLARLPSVEAAAYGVGAAVSADLPEEHLLWYPEEGA
jgi:hypothetical protein